ncbi:MAG: UDP-galactopyranose mutase [Frankiales bacterium]|nr:UDP-galactopyranose mutase [Frankiales bacterium]
MSRVVVIGAGVGGLAAAARLAHLGHDVTVCEASESVGGKLGLVEADTSSGGFRFDTGPSLVTMPQVFRDLFEDTGGWPRGLALEPLEPLARYRFADGTAFDASSDLDEHCARLDAALGDGNGDDWRAFTARAKRVWDASRGPFLESPLDGPRTIARLAARQPRDVSAIAPGRSLRSLGRRHLRDPRLRTYLDRYATYTGSDPRRAPAALAAVPYVEQAYGGWYVTGGLHRLGEAVRDRAVECGAVLRLGAEVVRIERTAGHACGVVLADGEHLPADVVVANADAATVYGSLVDAPTAARRLARATPSLSGFVLLLAVKGRTPGLAHHNVLFPSDYDAEFDAVFGDPARPVPDPTLYVSAPDDPAVRPEGCEAWFVLVNAPRHRTADHGEGRGTVDWRADGVSEAYADHLLDLLGERGLPVRDRVLWSQVLSPADLEERTGAVGGAIYGTSSNGASAAFLRPANRSPVPGLFLVGGSSHPGGGLPLVTLSAQIVAGLVGPA